MKWAVKKVHSGWAKQWTHFRPFLNGVRLHPEISFGSRERALEAIIKEMSKLLKTENKNG